MRKPKIYLGNALLFSQSIREHVLTRIVKIIEDMGVEVYEPWSRNGNAYSGKYWAYNIAQGNCRDLMDADAMFAILNGVPDEGVAFELGYAAAHKKPIFIFRDDLRIHADTNQYPLNIMIFSSFDPDRWQDNYYQSIDEIPREDKAFARWIASMKQENSVKEGS